MTRPENPPGYPQGYPPQQPPPPVKKRRRIFRWVFLAIQVLFIIWLISGISGVAAQACAPGLTQEACDAAKTVGGGIGVFLIIFLWVAVDVILGICYLIFRRR